MTLQITHSCFDHSYCQFVAYLMKCQPLPPHLAIENSHSHRPYLCSKYKRIFQSLHLASLSSSTLMVNDNYNLGPSLPMVLYFPVAGVCWKRARPAIENNHIHHPYLWSKYKRIVQSLHLVSSFAPTLTADDIYNLGHPLLLPKYAHDFAMISALV